MTAAAKHLTPVTLELGGKNPCYVSDTCDVQNVARRVVWGRFFNAGQTCIAPDYVLCSVEMQEKLMPALREAITEYFGSNPRESPDFGRIVGDKQFRRVRALLSSGRVAIGGQTDEKERYIGEEHGLACGEQGSAWQGVLRCGSRAMTTGTTGRNTGRLWRAQNQFRIFCNSPTVFLWFYDLCLGGGTCEAAGPWRARG